jgi:hypothetical protein
MFGFGFSISRVAALASSKGVVVGPYPLPAGSRWAYATTNGVRAMTNGRPALTLVKVS